MQADLPKIEGTDLTEVARRYERALSRVLATRAWGWMKHGWVSVLGCWAMPRFAGLMSNNVLDISGQSRHAATITLAVIYAALLAGLGGLLLVTARRWTADLDLRAIDLATRWYSTLMWTAYALAVVTVLSMLLPLTAAWLAVTGRDQPPVIWVRTVAFDSSLAIVTVLALWTAWVFLKFNQPDDSQERRALQPLDRVAVHLVTVAVFVHRCAVGRDETRFQDVRRLLAALERLAVQAERFALPRVPWQDRPARREARLEGLRLAAVIRAHKALLVRAVGPDDYAAVARSLTVGLGMWSQDDFAAMVRTAPAVTLPGWPRQVAVRLWPAAVLAAFGIVLPLLPPLNESAQAAASARASLLIGAVLALVTGAVRVKDYVTTIVEQVAAPK